jgi:MOSC domain-containing protein YiiM
VTAPARFPDARVIDIFVARARGAAMERVDHADVRQGQGIVGDRHFADDPSQDRVVTLIETEALAAVEREVQVGFAAEHCRRNLITSGVPLNHLVGVHFTIGSVLLLGKKLCEPCEHLAELTSAVFSKALVHRGGLRARVLSSGLLRCGDALLIEPPV